MDSWLTHQGKTNTGEIVHSISATISTIFLFTRIWARTNKYCGLWWDDYLLIASWILLLGGNGTAAALPSYGFRVLEGTEHGWMLMKCSASFFYLAAGLGKTAFATTLHRLSSGGTSALLRCIIALVCAFSLAVALITWAAICGQPLDRKTISETCVPQQTVIWVHTGNAIVTVCADFILAYLPWTILKKIYLPQKEKLATGLSMSLVGLAGVVCIVRVTILANVAKLQERDGEVDWTYASMAVWALAQSEVAIYIIAQTVPLLRVLLGRSSNNNSQIASHATKTGASGPTDKNPGKGKRTAGDNSIVSDAPAGVELVQLPTGKIVAADLEEGKAFKAHETPAEGPAMAPATSNEIQSVAQTGSDQANITGNAEDAVHNLWLSLGLSRRAWSQSPPREPEGQHQPANIQGAPHDQA